MTPELSTKLHQIGWFPERRLDESQVFEWLRIGVNDFGCHIFPEVVRVLQEYGDLVFGNLHFTPEGSLARGDKLVWLYWEWEVNEVLFPIAYELDGTFSFALSSTGKVYGSGTINMCCGDSFEEFLNNLLASQRGNGRWVDITTSNWTEEMDAQLERLYNAVYSEGAKS